MKNVWIDKLSTNWYKEETQNVDNKLQREDVLEWHYIVKNECNKEQWTKAKDISKAKFRMIADIAHRGFVNNVTPRSNWMIWE